MSHGCSMNNIPDATVSYAPVLTHRCRLERFSIAAVTTQHTRNARTLTHNADSQRNEIPDCDSVCERFSASRPWSDTALRAVRLYVMCLVAARRSLRQQAAPRAQFIWHLRHGDLRGLFTQLFTLGVQCGNFVFCSTASPRALLLERWSALLSHR